MKIQLLTVAGLILTACAGNNVKISGEVTSAEKQSVYLEQLNVVGSVTIDSTKTSSDGSFDFDLNITEPTLYSVRFANKQSVILMLKPDEKVSIKADYANLAKDYAVSGSIGSALIQEHSAQLNQTQAKLDSLRNLYTQSQDEMEKKEVSSQFDTLFASQLKYSRNFVLEHAIEPAMYYVLYQRLDKTQLFQTPEEIQSFRAVASSMRALYPESQYTKSIIKHYDQMTNDIKMYQLKNVIDQADKGLPELSLPNAKGDTITLQSFRGKYILLDFTILGVKENLEHMQDLNAVYQKYKNKGLVIYQVCLDPEEETWKQLAGRLNLEWICVYDKGSLKSINAANWNIQSVPSNYLINKEFDIVGKNLFGRRLSDRLSDIIK